MESLFSFPVGLLHPLQHAGLARRSPNCRRLGLKAEVFPTSSVLRSVQFLGESDEKPFRPADIAEPIRRFMLDYFAYELRAALVEAFKRLVDVVHGEHDAEVA